MHNANELNYAATTMRSNNCAATYRQFVVNNNNCWALESSFEAITYSTAT